MTRSGFTTAVPLALALVGCAPASAPSPIALSYPYRIEDAARFPGYERLAERVAGAYVRVLVYAEADVQDGLGTDDIAIVNGASGTIVDAQGHVVTPAHIAKGTRFKAKVTTLDGRDRAATIIDVAPEGELALLKIEPFAGMRPAALADTGAIRDGQPVVSIGTPHNRKGAVTVGIVSKARRTERIAYNEFGYDDAIELRMEVEPGHSGGPVFDTEGRLIGMIASFGLGDIRLVPYVSTMIAYAVPAPAIAAYLREVAR